VSIRAAQNGRVQLALSGAGASITSETVRRTMLTKQTPESRPGGDELGLHQIDLTDEQFLASAAASSLGMREGIERFQDGCSGIPPPSRSPLAASQRVWA